jgi:hypothetical protein
MDMTIEAYNITKKTNYTLDVFYLMKEGDGLFKETSQS